MAGPPKKQPMQATTEEASALGVLFLLSAHEQGMITGDQLRSFPIFQQLAAD